MNSTLRWIKSGRKTSVDYFEQLLLEGVYYFYMYKSHSNMKSSAVLYFLLILLASCSSLAAHAQGTKYICPMRCEGNKTYDKPGKCPVCGMELQPVADKQKSNGKLSIIGSMMNTIHNGQLQGLINLDTISVKGHLYGLGPLENLKGETLINDGHCYVSQVNADSSISVTETFDVKAPFFVYTNVDIWQVKDLPDDVQTLPQLEKYIDQITRRQIRPLAIRITAKVEDATIHIVNLPTGTQVHSPDDAHKGQKTLHVQGDVELIGFFSTEHQGIFTHHDSNVHIHLITADKKMMGHLDEIKLIKGGRIYIQL